MRDETDIALGAAAVTHPLWLDLLNQAAQEVVLIGGAALVIYRVGRLFMGKKEEVEDED